MPSAYYAVSAKVHALYGRRMQPEDYRQLTAKRTVPEAAAFLQVHPGYRDRLAGINTSSMHRETLENALRGAYVDEYRRIFSFMNLNDKELMRFPLYKAEHAAILASMRRLTSITSLEPVTTWDAMLQNSSNLDLSALQNADTFQGIAMAAERTIYGSALMRIAAGSRIISVCRADHVEEQKEDEAPVMPAEAVLSDEDQAPDTLPDDLSSADTDDTAGAGGETSPEPEDEL